MYRDDLEAALARNATLERRVAELERAYATRGVAVTAAPQSAPNVAPPVRRGPIAYVPPATWMPLANRLVHSFRHTLRSISSRIPSWEVPGWSSSIVVVQLLARPAAWLSACVSTLAMTIWFVVGMLWVVPALAIAAVGFALGSLVLLPIIAIASVRRSHDHEALRGVEWGIARPTPDDPDELFLYTVLSASFLNLPLSLWLLGS